MSPPNKPPYEDKLTAYNRQLMVNTSHWPAVTSKVRSSILKQQQQKDALPLLPTLNSDC